MWESFFGFKKTPFGDSPDAKQLFASQAWNQVKARLEFLAQHHGVGLVTGEVGAGSVTARTAVYGPVCTVVWQGSAGDRRPYADQIPFARAKRPRSPVVFHYNSAVCRAANLPECRFGPPSQKSDMTSRPSVPRLDIPDQFTMMFIALS